MDFYLIVGLGVLSLVAAAVGWRLVIDEIQLRRKKVFIKSSTG